MGTLVGSFATVARLLDEVMTVPGTGGVLLVFDDFLKGLDDFGTHIQPLMETPAHHGRGRVPGGGRLMDAPAGYGIRRGGSGR